MIYYLTEIVCTAGIRSLSGSRNRQSPSVSTVELNIHGKARQAKVSGVINKRTGFTPSDTGKLRKGKTSSSTDEYSRPSTDVSHLYLVGNNIYLRHDERCHLPN